MMNNNIDHIVWACPDLITTPELPDVMKICSWVGINADFAEAKEPKLEIFIDTPKGEFKLETPQPLPIGDTFE